MVHSQPRVRGDFQPGIDSLLLKRVPYHAFDGKFAQNGKLGQPGPNRKAYYPQEQIHVVDTPHCSCSVHRLWHQEASIFIQF
jgi:hypothetical protein